MIPMSLKPLMLSANEAPEAGFEFALEHKFKKMHRTGCVLGDGSPNSRVDRIRDQTERCLYGAMDCGLLQSIRAKVFPW